MQNTKVWKQFTDIFRLFGITKSNTRKNNWQSRRVTVEMHSPAN